MINLFKNASWGGVSAAVRLLFGMGNIFMAIKLSGAVSYGYLTVMLSVTAFYVALINSVHTIAVTHAADLRHQHNSQGLNTLFSAVWALTLLSSILLAFAVFFLGQLFLHAFVYWGPDVLINSRLSSLLVLVVIIAACQIFSAGNVAVIESLGRFDLAARVQLFGPPVVFILLALGLYADHQLSIVAVGKAMIAGGAVDLLLTTWLRIKMGYLGSFKLTFQTIKLFPDLFKDGMALQGARLINIFFDPFNKFLLNRFVGPASVSSYEIAMKIIFGIQGLFGGAFRSFLQITTKLSEDGSRDYLKVLRYGLVPAVLIHGIGGVFLVMVSRYWLKGELGELSFFYMILIPSSLCIIFIAPLYSALIGIRDIGFIFRMHLNVAVLNFIASIILIPIFGLYGAAVGFSIAIFYNVFAEYHRYTRMIGSVTGLRLMLLGIAPRLLFTFAISVTALISEVLLQTSTSFLIMELVMVVILSVLLLNEPISIRVARALIGRFSNYF